MCKRFLSLFLCVCLCKRGGMFIHAHVNTFCVLMRVCALICILALHVKLSVRAQYTMFHFLNSSILPAPAPKNKVEVHAKMLWVSIKNFSSWMQNPDSFWLCFGPALSPVLALLQWGEKTLAEGNLTLPFPFTHSLSLLRIYPCHDG